MPDAAHSRWIRQAPRWLLASFITVVLTWLLLLTKANASTSGILYLTVVVLYSTLAGRWISVYLAVCSALLFDYYFFPPIGSLEVSRPADWISIFAFAGSCLVVNRVADRARMQTVQAERRRESVEQLYALSQEMMLHDDAREMVRHIPRQVEQVFALDAVLLYVSDGDQLYSSMPGAAPVDPADGTTSASTWSSEELHQAMRKAAAAEATSDLPEGYASTRLDFGMHNVGVLAWKPTSLSMDVATLVAAQVATAITRALAITLSTRLEAARSADRLRTALIDSLTHELRTPLTAIRAASTTLLDGHGVDDALRTELITIVDEESSRLDDMIGEAMEMAEIEAGSFRVQALRLRAGDFFDDLLERMRPVLARHPVTVQDEEPDAMVTFDPHLLSRVLRHLLENAARYSPPGTPITIMCRRPEGRVEFEVEDRGPGINPHDLPHIFDKFYRGRHLGMSTKGSGMGLAIARAILTAHGGGIEARSTLGKGSNFRVWVPMAT